MSAKNYYTYPKANANSTAKFASNGTNNKKLEWTQERLQECNGYLAKGFSLSQIAELTGRTEKAIKFKRVDYINNELKNGKTLDFLAIKLNVPEQDLKK